MTTQTFDTMTKEIERLRKREQELAKSLNEMRRKIIGLETNNKIMLNQLEKILNWWQSQNSLRDGEANLMQIINELIIKIKGEVK